jgi:hypothetical protein
MIGIEMVEDASSRKPLNANSFVDIWERCKDLGVLLGKGGINGNVRKFLLFAHPTMLIKFNSSPLSASSLLLRGDDNFGLLNHKNRSSA